VFGCRRDGLGTWRYFGCNVTRIILDPILLAEGRSKRNTPMIVEGDWSPYTAATIEPHYDYDLNDLKLRQLEGFNIDFGKGLRFIYNEAKRLFMLLEWTDLRVYRSKWSACIQIGERQNC
jgi:hypothetical protein